MVFGLVSRRQHFLLLALTMFAAGCGGGDKHVTLKLAHTLDTTHSVHQAMVFMGERLKELSDGTMDIDIYPSGQLGSERDTMELLQVGSLAITKVSTSPMGGFVAEMKVFSIPFVFGDEEHLWEVGQGPSGEELLEAGEGV